MLDALRQTFGQSFDDGRMILFVFSPPGIFLHRADQGVVIPRLKENQVFGRMSLGFPNSVIHVILPGDLLKAFQVFVRYVHVADALVLSDQGLDALFPVMHYITVSSLRGSLLRLRCPLFRFFVHFLFPVLGAPVRQIFGYGAFQHATRKLGAVNNERNRFVFYFLLQWKTPFPIMFVMR